MSSRSSQLGVRQLAGVQCAHATVSACALQVRDSWVGVAFVNIDGGRQPHFHGPRRRGAEAGAQRIARKRGLAMHHFVPAYVG